MQVIDIKELIRNLKLDEAICEAFAKKMNKSEEEMKEIVSEMIDKQIDNIGKSMINAKDNPEELSRLRGLSLDDFMKDNDKIIKDK